MNDDFRLHLISKNPRPFIPLDFLSDNMTLVPAHSRLSLLAKVADEALPSRRKFLVLETASW